MVMYPPGFSDCQGLVGGLLHSPLQVHGIASAPSPLCPEEKNYRPPPFPLVRSTLPSLKVSHSIQITCFLPCQDRLRVNGHVSLGPLKTLYLSTPLREATHFYYSKWYSDFRTQLTGHPLATSFSSRRGVFWPLNAPPVLGHVVITFHLCVFSVLLGAGLCF